jgi:hypothetical protein
MQSLPNIFRDRIISSNIWPARSPDLNRYHFFFWGCSEEKFHKSNNRTEDLKENIRREISNIPAPKGKSEYLPLVRGLSACRGTAFSTTPVICEL